MTQAELAHRVAIYGCAVEPESGHNVRGAHDHPAGRGFGLERAVAGTAARRPRRSGCRSSPPATPRSSSGWRCWAGSAMARGRSVAVARVAASGDVSWSSWRIRPRVPPRSRQSARHADAWPSGPEPSPGLCPAQTSRRQCGQRLAATECASGGVHPAALVVGRSASVVVSGISASSPYRRTGGSCRRAEPGCRPGAPGRDRSPTPWGSGPGRWLVSWRLHGDRLAAAHVVDLAVDAVLDEQPAGPHHIADVGEVRRGLRLPTLTSSSSSSLQAARSASAAATSGCSGPGPGG